MTATVSSSRPFVGPILVSLDESEEARAALRVAAALATKYNLQPQVLAVSEEHPYPVPTAEPHGPLVYEIEFEERARSRALAIREQVANVLGCEVDWPIDVKFGVPGDVIVEEARRRDVALLVMGLRHHSALAHALQLDTALQVIRRGRVSVLAVRPELVSLPRRVAVAMDFSGASIRAAQAAVNLLGAGATLFVVHVQPSFNFDVPEDGEGWAVIWSQGVRGAFDQLTTMLVVPPDAHVERVVLVGDPSRELLAFAERSHVDLVTVGSKRHTLADKLLIGTVTTTLIRAAHCSVLVTPPAAASSA